MISKTIKYTDYNGRERTDEFYFNLNKNELIEMNLDYDEGMEEFLRKIVKADNAREVYKILKKIILSSYGEKTSDGRFVKSEEMAERFTQTVAYDELIMELLNDTTALAAFIRGMLPGEYQKAYDDAKLSDDLDVIVK